jgi:hypothetical protein
VTKADPVWGSRGHDSNVAAQAAARESVHVASPLRSSRRNVYDEPHPQRNCSVRAGSGQKRADASRPDANLSRRLGTQRKMRALSPWAMAAL